MMRQLLNDEAGFLISAELLLILTLMICGVVVGMATVRDALVQELGDVAEAIGALDQSYNYRALRAPREKGGTHARCGGSGFNDEEDDCDCKGIILRSVRGKDDPSTLDNPEASN